MATRPSRLERITNLFLALLETQRPLSLREIGVAVAGYPTEPVALRQAFERDKRTLREEGVPIAVERIEGEEQVGYRILPEEYYLPPLGLSEEEREALAFALAAVRMEGGAGGGALEKLSPRELPQLPPVAVLPTLPALGELQEAVRTRRVVHFTYRGKAREVEGDGLVFRLGAWYFIGRDRSSASQLKTFRVDRFEAGPTFDEPASYERPERSAEERELRFAAWALPSSAKGDRGADDAMEVTLDVDVRELSYARALLGERSLVERGADGSGRFRFLVADEEAFVGWVVGQGEAVEVIGPGSLRERVVSTLERLAEPVGEPR